MTLLDTVPIYITPIWYIVLMILTGGIFLGILVNSEGERIELIIVIICLIILITGFILGMCGIPKVYSHDEYVIELKDMSATEFFSQYEITKTFDYSNAWQVKKKDGVK